MSNRLMVKTKRNEWLHSSSSSAVQDLVAGHPIIEFSWRSADDIKECVGSMRAKVDGGTKIHERADSRRELRRCIGEGLFV